MSKLNKFVKSNRLYDINNFLIRQLISIWVQYLEKLAQNLLFKTDHVHLRMILYAKKKIE